MKSITITTNSADETINLGKIIGANLKGHEVLECISDLGGGKTTFVKGLVNGFGSSDPVASPSFTISYVYKRNDDTELHHFDFYRLSEPGIVKNELAEVINDDKTVVAIEWADITKDVLPDNRLIINIKATSENSREIKFSYPEELEYLIKGISS